MKRIAIVTDTSPEQKNGVVRTMNEMIERLRAVGHAVQIVTLDPTRMWIPSGYPGIKLQFNRQRVARELDAFTPDFVHLVTEGPIGVAGRAWCLKRHHAFTTAFHTRYPDYMHARFSKHFGARAGEVARRVSARYLRWFHGPSSAVMAATETLRSELREQGYRRLAPWTRGVNLEQFKAYGADACQYPQLQRPIFVTHCRIAVEKNLHAFLSEVKGSKVVIGDGPLLAELRRNYPDVHFTGMLEGPALGKAISGADVYVFPSLTETFGLVLVEAIASGLPLAGYDTAINQEILKPLGENVACLGTDLADAARRALSLKTEGLFDAGRARERIKLSYTWEISAKQFFDNLCANTAPRERRLRYLGRLSRPFQPWPSFWRAWRNPKL